MSPHSPRPPQFTCCYFNIWTIWKLFTYPFFPNIGSSDLVQRLQLLTIHFPKLRILWSPGPHATADLFAELKRGREEPDAAKAASISMDIIGIVLQAIFFCEIAQICWKIAKKYVKQLARSSIKFFFFVPVQMITTVKNSTQPLKILFWNCLESQQEMFLAFSTEWIVF